MKLMNTPNTTPANVVADQNAPDSIPSGEEHAGPPAPPAAKPRRRGQALRKLKAILTLLLIGLVAVFAVQNSEDVEIQFLTWSFTTPRALLVVLFLIVGFALGLITTSFSTLKKRR